MDHEAFAHLLGSYGEFIGAIGVIVTLAYLAVQVRQNTAMQRIDTAQQVLGISARNQAMLAQGGVDYHHMMLEVWQTEEFSPEYRSRFSSAMMSVFAQHWQVRYQYEAGLLDREVHDAYERRLQDMARNEKFVSWWRERRSYFGASFAGYVDDIFGTMVDESVASARHPMNHNVAQEPQD